MCHHAMLRASILLDDNLYASKMKIMLDKMSICLLSLTSRALVVFDVVKGGEGCMFLVINICVSDACVEGEHRLRGSIYAFVFLFISMLYIVVCVCES